jgi:hypothetical protein
MARTFLVFGDIEDKLDVLRVECTKCDRKGRYSVAKLIEKHGRKATSLPALTFGSDRPLTTAPQSDEPTSVQKTSLTACAS